MAVHTVLLAWRKQMCNQSVRPGPWEREDLPLSLPHTVKREVYTAPHVEYQYYSQTKKKHKTPAATQKERYMVTLDSLARGDTY